MTPDFSVIDTVFTPGAPIKTESIFAGRKDQLTRVYEAISSPGRHPIVFGLRGVGKTSLANIVSEKLGANVCLKETCFSDDTFHTIWLRVLNKFCVQEHTDTVGLIPQRETQEHGLGDMLSANGPLTPASVGRELVHLGANIVVILDEFDQLHYSRPSAESAPTTKHMADLIKYLSDLSSDVTIMCVGVGQTIATLIGDHASISRNIAQVELPLMDDAEIMSIVKTGALSIRLGISDEVLKKIAVLSAGFPHYAHLLGWSIAKVAEKSSLVEIGVDELEKDAYRIAVDNSIETYRTRFSIATRTSQPSRYSEILCACGFADHDDQGVFRATDVVTAYKEVFGDSITVPGVVPALGEFCKPSRENALVQVPVGKVNHYRLGDPMMRPFLRIKGQSLKASN